MYRHRRRPPASARIVARTSPRPRAVSVERLEERVLFALAGGGYSGTLSSNAVIAKQQLIADPAEPREGSTSVTYDPKVVHLSGYVPGPGYNNKGFLGFVEIHPFGAPAAKRILQPLVAFLQKAEGEETGYVQVKYQLSGTAGQITPPKGYTIMDEDGVTGVDTHALFFDRRAGMPATANARYSIFAARANTRANNTEDYLINNEDGTRSGPDDLSPAFVSSNLAPVVTSAGGPYTIAEGSSLTLRATATDKDTAASLLTYAWDLNGDGKTDATGASPTVSPSTLASLGLGDGPRTAAIRLTVGDGDKSATATTTLTVTNVVPTAGIAGPDPALNGSTAFTFTASDPSAADRAAGFRYLINWGDGSATQTIAATANNGAGLKVNHTYTKVGVFEVTLTATDKDGGTSPAVKTLVGVKGAQLRPDPYDPSKLALYVVGSSNADVIRFGKSGSGSSVTINGASFGTFKGFGRIIAYGLGGNDDIRLDYAAAAEAVFFGGAGNDTLVAGNYLSLLVGGEGDDNLVSGNAKDLLVGGGGADRLNGGDGEDLLVAGRTAYDNGSDADVRALTAIFREWTGGSSYESRIGHITGALAGGSNGSAVFRVTDPNRTAFDDGAADSLTGGTGRDWFLLRRGSGVLDASDLGGTETGTAL